MSDPREAALNWIAQALAEEYSRDDPREFQAMAVLLDGRCSEMGLLTEALVLWLHESAPREFSKILGAWYVDSASLAAEQKRLTGVGGAEGEGK